jgi:hypothetical protein
VLPLPGNKTSMEETKIQLSEDELLLMQNSNWILTKNGIIEKISQGFGQLAARMEEKLKVNPLAYEEIILGNPKISRGEKYEALPYVILDYPRMFGKEDILAIRTLFWWGNYCSITLHVKGVWQTRILQKLSAARQSIPSTFYISFSGNEWGHNLYHHDYTLLQQLSGEELLQKLPLSGFLKLAAKVEIGNYSIMENKLFEHFLILSALIEN